MNKAILLSGGIDSTALTFLLKDEISLAITVDYGQRCALSEVNVSERICNILNIKHEVISINCNQLGSGDMATTNSISSLSSFQEWWPFRNQLIITVASMKLIQYHIETLLIGSVKSDKKFSDGSMNFFKAINRCVSMQEGNIQIKAPALKKSSLELVVESNIPDGLLLWAHSCHTSNNPCGNCNGCRKYLQVMKKLGIN